MSLDQLKEIDEYHFFIRLVNDDIKISTAPFFVKPCGANFVLTMLRDVEFCFKAQDNDVSHFELYAVRKAPGDTVIKLMQRVITFIRNGKERLDVKRVCKWCVTCDESFDKKSNTWFEFGTFKVKFWIKWMNKAQYWFCSNPELELESRLLFDILC